MLPTKSHIQIESNDIETVMKRVCNKKIKCILFCKIYSLFIIYVLIIYSYIFDYILSLLYIIIYHIISLKLIIQEQPKKV